MTVTRRWFCSCLGIPRELAEVEGIEDEPTEPVCPKCGATPSSDPRHTITYADRESWDD